MTIEHLEHVAAPVPPNLAEALGYRGASRFVAFWWDADDKLAFSDGVRSQTGGLRWFVWKIYLGHLAVLPHVMGFNFGASDAEAEHRLVVDRRDGRLHAGAAAAVAAFLRSTQSASEPSTSRPAAEEAIDVALLVRNKIEEVRVSQEDRDRIAARVQRDQALEHQVYQELQAWLDRQLG